MLKNSFYLLLVVFLMACSSNDDTVEEIPVPLTLAEMISSGPVALEGVIACASSSEIEDEVVVYLYPRPGVTNVRYFETETAEEDPSVYENYTEVIVTPEDYFNGYFSIIKRILAEEKWVIVTFEEEDVLQVSNPIRLKHKTQKTIFRESIHTGSIANGMPLFSWGNISHPEDVIYFEVVSDDTNTLLSGTYTEEPVFQYYKTDNVVLNITRETPPDLESGRDYHFTTLGVSIDNWVNLFADRPFFVE